MNRILVLIGLLIVIFVAVSILTNGYESSIEKKVERNGGEIVSIDSRAFNIGPFRIKTKEQYIYRFEYEQDGKSKVGWVRFGPFDDDWIMDYKE